MQVSTLRDAVLYRSHLPADDTKRREAVEGIAASVERVLAAAGGGAREDSVPGELAGRLEAGSQQGGSIDIHIRLEASKLEVEILPADRDEPPAPAFRTWLLQRLRAEGLSQERAARRIGVSTRTVGRWARGQTQPRMRDLSRVREALGDLPAF